MTIKRKIYKSILIASIICSTGITLTSFPVLAQTGVSDSKNLEISGSVFDSTNSGIKDVYIKQQNTLNTVLSDDKGSFKIKLDGNAERKLLISKEGYESILLNVLQGENNLKVTLYPLIKYENKNLPEPHTEISDMFNYISRPISSTFSAFYQIRNQKFTLPSLSAGSSLSSGGWSINEIGINAQLLFNKWMGTVKVFRSRYPINIENFNSNPAFNVDTTQFQLGGGRVFKVSDSVDLYGGVAYLFHFSNSDNRAAGNNKPIPFTNSYLDFPQTRQGPGVSGTFGWIITKGVILNLGATIYPYIFTTFDGLDKANMGYTGMLDAGASLKFETIPGVYLSAGYSNQYFFGTSLNDDSNFFNLGVTLDPFKMANVNPVEMK